MYMFKSKYQAVTRQITIYDSEGTWIGTLAVNPHGVVTHTMTHESPRLIECEKFGLTNSSLRKFAIKAAYDSGIDEDVMFDIEARSTVIASGYTFDDIMPFKGSVKSSNDPIFDAWMNR